MARVIFLRPPVDCILRAGTCADTYVNMKNATHPLNGHAPWTVHFADGSSPWEMGSRAEALNYLRGNFAVVKQDENGHLLAWDFHCDAENDPMFSKVAARVCPAE